MTTRLLARANRALRDEGLPDTAVAAVRVGAVGTARRTIIAVVCAIAPLPFLASALDLGDRGVLVAVTYELIIAVLLTIAIVNILRRFARPDPLLAGRGPALMIITEHGLQMSVRRGWRRRWTATLKLPREDVSMARVRPALSMLDPAQITIRRRFGDVVTYEVLAGKRFLPFAAALHDLVPHGAGVDS